ncbi:hypothetical protein ACN38_g11886 [Penicillium nordicum]|uniref:Major facilitator superfamily (MFS) profile domain-containing protein n=1 Tax=Penicillium nordicum TaxID=229535 RepID=A0A0M9WAJ5_9EURO|nr:hypothetical protein ACN38_g11886 [Penicillium nordicum]
MVPMTCIVLYPIAEKLLFEPIHSAFCPVIWCRLSKYLSLILGKLKLRSRQGLCRGKAQLYFATSLLFFSLLLLLSFSPFPPYLSYLFSPACYTLFTMELQQIPEGSDYNYKRTAQKFGFPVDRKKGDDLRNIPIERTRLQTVFLAMAIGVAAFIPYGWVLQQRVHLAVPLVLQFTIGFCFVASLNCLNTLLVDLFPDKPATAASACNFVRCCLGAVGAAAISQMLSGMGWGWCFVLLGLVMGFGMGLLWVESIYGMGWRQKRLLKIERKKVEKEVRAAGIQVEGKGDAREQKDTNVDVAVADAGVTGGTDTRPNQ